MQAINFILSFGQQGVDIANLHEALGHLGFGGQVPEDERAEQRYGEGTADAVRQLQQQLGVPTEQFGSVDEPSAEFINQALLEQGVFNLVEGQVSHPDQRPAVGNLLFAFDRDNIGGAYLGSANTNADGFYRMFYDPRRYAVPGEGVLQVKDVIDLVVQVYDEAGATLAESAPLHDAERKVRVDLRIVTRAKGPQPCNSQVVGGWVQREDGLPLADNRIRATHEEERGSFHLGENITDDSGRYTIRYELLPGVDGVNLKVSVIGDDGGTVVSSQVASNAKPVETIDLVVPATSRPSEQRRLEGRIVFDNGLPAEQLPLRLYRLDFGGIETQLSETLTRELGLYVLPFDLEGKLAGLEVRAVDLADRETPLSKSMHDLGNEARIIVNLVAPATLQPLAPEYKRLAADLTLYVGEMQALAGARESAERQDLTVLNRATGWDARLIATATLAAQLSAQEEVGLPQEVLYGLLRAGLPSDKMQLARVSAEALDQALTKVREAGIVQIEAAAVPQILKDFETFSVNARLAVHAPGSQATYGQMLGTLDLGEDEQNAFAKIYLNHRGDAKSLWSAAENAGLGAIVPKLQRQGKLAFLTTNNPNLSQKLQTELGDAGPQQLVKLGLYKKEAWLDRIDMVPSAYASAADPKNAYAKYMSRKVRISYSTEVTWHMIDSGELEIEGDNANLSAFLKNAIDKGFKLGQTAIESFIKDNPSVFDGIAGADRDTTKEMVKTLQRVYQITPGNDAMKALLNAGLLSAQDVLTYPLDVFLERFGALFPTMEQAMLVYRKAEQVSNITYSIFSLAKELDNSPSVFAMSGSSEVRQAVKDELVKHFPTMESLFGSLDYCECEECRSVLSPAAYLVDLLQFLDRELKVWQNTLKDWKAKHGNAPYPFRSEGAFDTYLARWHTAHPGEPDPNTERTPYEVLIDRRPDLPHIALSCENTNTALPQIDLVNEILEYYVANSKLAKDAAHDTGDATTVELLAEPQNVIREAYDTLLSAQYPLNLPFDLWLETVRKFCDYFETPLWQVLETFRQSDDLFRPTAAYDRAAIFFEALGLSPSEVAIFTSPDPLSEWFRLYGFETPAATLDKAVDAETGQQIDINSAKALSRRLGVTYKEISAIVQTAFVNPGLSDLALLYKLGMTIADARDYTKNKGLYDQNQDIVGKRRADLAPADQQRFDDLTKKLADSQLTGWDVVNEVEAVEHRLSELVMTFNTPLNDLQAAIQAIPYDRVLILADTDTGCNFDQTTLQYADGTKADPIVFLRINLFVRLWRKLGWSIEETDRALSTFIPRKSPYNDNPDNLAKQPLKTALIYLAHLNDLEAKLTVGKQNRMKLLTLWSDIPTTGKQSLYAQLFLTCSARKSAEVMVMIAGSPRHLSVFDDPLGRYLEPSQLTRLADQVRYEVRLPGVKAADQINAAVFAGEDRIGLRYDHLGEVQYLNYVGVLTDVEKNRLAGLASGNTLSTLLGAVQDKAAEFRLIKGHMLVLQGALGLTADEIGTILVDVGTSLDEATLTLPNVSTLYRYGLLAKALKLSVSELIALKQLSGFDPFKPLHTDPLTTLDQDHPLSQTLMFVKVAEEVKDSGFNIKDLKYLLQHRFNYFGNYRQNGETMLALTKTLAEGIRAILAEHAVPANPGDLTDDILRQKLGLALPPDVVERFWAMLNGTSEFTVTKSTVTDDDHLPATSFVGELAISQVAYNAIRQEQKLVFRGVLFDAQKTELKDKFSVTLTAGQRATFAALLDAAQIEANKQANEFFTKHLQEQTLTASATAGFLKEEDFDKIFEPVPTIKDDLPEDQKQAARKENDEKLRAKRSRLTTTFLPFLQRRLIRQLVVQALTADTGADASLVESLLVDKTLLTDPMQNTQPLLNAFVATGERGVSARFYADPTPPLESADQAALSVLLADADTSLKDDAGNSLKPPGTNSARLEGWLEVPAAGVYRFFAALDKQNAEAELRFAHLPDPVFTGKATQDNEELGKEEKEYVELKPGVPYRFTLELRNLDGGDAQLRVQGETLPKDSLAQLTLYTESAVQRSGRAQMLLAKALRLLQTLGLNERELRYISSHADDFDSVSLSALLTQDNDNTPALAFTLFKQFLRLAAYSRLKRELAGGTDDLIGIFEANGMADPDRLGKVVYPLIAKLTSRDETTVKVVARALAEQPSFASEESLERLWAALQVVERLGVPVASLLEWTRIVSPKASPTQRSKIAANLKEAIKARFEPETWQRVAQPIFDKLRQRKRDALVTYVMHQYNFNRIEQLFEFFLIDPGVEPVVQTSRIRSAIGAVQIFIYRCLINLEPGVAASAINSKQWQWMKRYPVWAGNRKLWLFPENILEPEFRDDKTHLFAEVEGKLLQSDVSNDMAEDAFFTYLKKLDELARLDIVAMYCEEQPLDPASNRLHVIGRTYLEPYRYFYRRYAHEMWTPWEPMPVEIEGNHIVPIVWRDRLNVFWVTFIDNPDTDKDHSDERFHGMTLGKVAKIGVSLAAFDDKKLKDVPSKEKASNKKLTELSLGQLADAVRSAMTHKWVKVQLHWSEYFQGEWSVRESGGYSASLVKRVPLDFDSNTVFIHATKELGEEERGVKIHLGGAIEQAFHLVSRNSRPKSVSSESPPLMPYNASEVQANRYRGSGAFKVTFTQRIDTEVGKTNKMTMATPSILHEGEGFTVLPCANTITFGTPEIASLVSPLFYQDDRSNTFFVEPMLKEKTIEEWEEWVTRTPLPEVEWDHSFWWDKLDLKPLVPKPKLPLAVHLGDPIWRTEIDARARFELGSRQDWLVNSQTLVQLDGELVGSVGRAGLTVQPIEVVGASEVAALTIKVNPGSAIAPGQSVVAVDAIALAAAGLSQNGTGLNIIGGTGLNSTLLTNIKTAKGL